MTQQLAYDTGDQVTYQAAFTNQTNIFLYINRTLTWWISERLFSHLEHNCPYRLKLEDGLAMCHPLLGSHLSSKAQR